MKRRVESGTTFWTRLWTRARVLDCRRKPGPSEKTDSVVSVMLYIQCLKARSGPWRSGCESCSCGAGIRRARAGEKVKASRKMSQSVQQKQAGVGVPRGPRGCSRPRRGGVVTSGALISGLAPKKAGAWLAASLILDPPRPAITHSARSPSIATLRPCSKASGPRISSHDPSSESSHREPVVAPPISTRHTVGYR
jgi:hypothetical protein